MEIGHGTTQELFKSKDHLRKQTSMWIDDLPWKGLNNVNSIIFAEKLFI